MTLKHNVQRKDTKEDMLYSEKQDHWNYIVLICLLSNYTPVKRKEVASAQFRIASSFGGTQVSD